MISDSDLGVSSLQTGKFIGKLIATLNDLTPKHQTCCKLYIYIYMKLELLYITKQFDFLVGSSFPCN